MARQKTKTKNRNANVRSKLSPCKNSKHKTQWPEASTQANQQHRETKTLQVLTAQKTPLTKIKHDGRTKKPQKITRTSARSKYNPSKNRKRKTPWPEARTHGQKAAP